MQYCLGKEEASTPPALLLCSSVDLCLPSGQEAVPHEPVVAAQVLSPRVALGGQQSNDTLVLLGVMPSALHANDIKGQRREVNGLQNEQLRTCVQGGGGSGSEHQRPRGSLVNPQGHLR